MRVEGWGGGGELGEELGEKAHGLEESLRAKSLHRQHSPGQGPRKHHPTPSWGLPLPHLYLMSGGFLPETQQEQELTRWENLGGGGGTDGRIHITACKLASCLPLPSVLHK